MDLPKFNKELSRRQIQVAVLIARSISNKEIARILGIQESTVKGIIKIIFHKLKLDSRLQITIWVARKILLIETQKEVNSMQRGNH